MRPCWKQIMDSILLTTTKLHNNHILCFFCAWGTSANKFLVIFNIRQTGCCKIVLMKKQIDVSHGNFFRDSIFFAINSVTLFLPIVSLRATTLPSIFLHLFLVKTPPFLPPLQTKLFQRHFLLLIQLKSERKLADFRFFNTQLC